MRTEQKQSVLFLVRSFGLVVFASLYAIGGSGDFFGGELWLRRWLAPAVLAAVAFLVSWDWRMLAAYPLMGLALTLPYGADETWQKWLLRGLFGLSCALAYNIPNLLNRRWVLSGFGAVLAVVASVILGVYNPMPDAIIEQGCIGLLIGFTYIFGAKTMK